MFRHTIKPSTEHMKARTRSSHSAIFLAMMLVLLASTFLLSLKSGAVSLDWGRFLQVLSGLPESSALDRSIVWQIRLPRLLLAVATGGALAVGGVVMQAMFRNPLAEPGLMGVSAGAALGAVAGMLAGWLLSWQVGLVAFLGAGLAMVVSYLFGRRVRGAASLLLAGVAVNALCMSMVSLLLSWSSDPVLRNFVFWTMGSLSSAGWNIAIWLAPWSVLMSLVVWMQWRSLNALLLGEREAHHLGFHVSRLRGRLLLSVALLVGPVVAFTGGIAFVGLLVPHMIRMWTGASHKGLLLLAWLGGGWVLLMADWIARTAIQPAELPVGVVTSLVGAPFFLWLLRRNVSINPQA